MTTNLTTWALVLGLGLVPLAAQPGIAPHKGNGPRQAFLMGHMADRLKLTESQKAQIQAIETRHAEVTKNKAQAATEARKAFREAAQNPDAAPAQLKALHQAKSDKALELLLDRRAMRSEIRALLTPEQRIELDKLQAYRQGLKQGRRGMHKGGMGL